MSINFNRASNAFVAFITFAMVSMSSNAYADVFEETFRNFSSCDAGFFRALNKNADAWKSAAVLKSNGNDSWISVKNRFDEKENNVEFLEHPKMAGLTLLSFFDETTDLGDMGLYYYWGFTFEGKLDDVVEKLKPLIFNNERLRAVDGTYVRTEVKILGSRWLPLATSANTPTGIGKIERLLLIEPHEERRNAVRVSCSLQGGINAAVLKEVRPDIDPKDYPKQISTTLFDDVSVPNAVAETARNTSWLPKFKKLTYTYINKADSSDTPVTVEMEAQDHLIRVKEIYSSFFNVQRLKLAGIVQIKARMNGIGDGRVYLTTDLKMSLPTVLDKGAKLSIFEIMHPQPSRAGDKEMQVSISCDVGEEFDAKDLFPNLTGKAHKLFCTFSGPSHIETKVFLDDIGIAVTLESKSQSGNKAYKFTRFEIEK